MENKYNIDELKSNELNQLIDLFVLVWNGDKTKVKGKTEWAFINSVSKILVVRNDLNEIVGARGGIKWPLIINDKEIECYQFHGTCVHPEYRRQGLFSVMNKEYLKISKADGVEFIFNVSVKASRLGYEKLGWKYLKGFHRLTKIHVQNILFKHGEAGQFEKNGVDLAQIPEELFHARESQFKGLIHTRYDDSFLKWRLKNKSENYKISHTPNAIIIYKLKFNNDRKELIIGEFFLKNGKYPEFYTAMKMLNKKEKPHISYTYIFNTHPYYKFYLRYFFLPNPLNYNLNFGTKTLGNEKDILNSKLGISFLDIDTF